MISEENNIIDGAYALIEKINEAIKAAEEAAIYGKVLDAAVEIKVEACSEIEQDMMNSTYLPIAPEDIPDLKAYLKVLVLKRGQEANDFLEKTLGRKKEEEKKEEKAEAPETQAAAVDNKEKNAGNSKKVSAEDIIKAHDEDGLTFEEIGRKYEIPRSSAYNIYKRSKK